MEIKDLVKKYKLYLREEHVYGDIEKMNAEEVQYIKSQKDNVIQYLKRVDEERKEQYQKHGDKYESNRPQLQL